MSGMVFRGPAVSGGRRHDRLAGPGLIQDHGNKGSEEPLRGSRPGLVMEPPALDVNHLLPDGQQRPLPEFQEAGLDRPCSDARVHPDHHHGRYHLPIPAVFLPGHLPGIHQL